jgi:hypothetical protein
MDLEQIHQSLSAGFTVKNKLKQKIDTNKQKTDQPKTTMRHFTVIKMINIVAAIMFLVMGVCLIVSFVLNLSLVPELKEAANFDRWGPFILIAGIVAVLTAIIFAFGAWKEVALASGARNSVVAETIFILGLPAPAPEAEISPTPQFAPLKGMVHMITMLAHMVLIGPGE